MKKLGFLFALCAMMWMTVSPAAAQGVLPGKFTINKNGDKVQFAKGNLQYQPSTRTWRFAPNQWDMIGRDNEEISATYDGWLDLFAFSAADDPLKLEDNMDYKKWKDWEVLPISNGGNKAKMWQTMSLDEWNYIIAGRANAKTLHSQATVCGIYGYIFLPDDWKLPEGLTWVPKCNNWTSNVYDAEAWKKMEKAGAVFLPAAGSRKKNIVVNLSSNGYYNRGFYWTNTSREYDSTDVRGHYISFYVTTGAGWGGTDPASGYSVRLVCKAGTVQPDAEQPAAVTAEQSSTPAAEEQKPTAEEQKPAAEVQKPETEVQQPAADAQQPAPAGSKGRPVPGPKRPVKR